MPKSFLVFNEVLNPGGVTKRWLVTNVGGQSLGWVQWHSPWRKYVYGSREGIIYDPNCLTEIHAFITDQTAKHKAVRSPL